MTEHRGLYQHEITPTTIFKVLWRRDTLLPDRRRDRSPRDCIFHVYVNGRNCHHGNTQRISRHHHHRSLEMSQVFRLLADRRMRVLADAEAGWQRQQREISRTRWAENRACPTEVSFFVVRSERMLLGQI